MFKWEVKEVQGFIEKNNHRKIHFKVKFGLVLLKTGEIQLKILKSKLDFMGKESIREILQGIYISFFEEFKRLYLNPNFRGNCN